MKPINTHKNLSGFITIQEEEHAKRKAVVFLQRVKAAETQEGKAIFTGTVSGKYTQLTIKGEQAEEKFLALCLEKGWESSNFRRS